MGMFDYVKIDKKFLPDEIKEMDVDLEWQSKSHDKLLNILTIDSDGKLFTNNITDNWVQSGENKFLSYTGEIRFYTDINEIWWEFVAFFEKGILLKCIQIEPNV